jgi:hypothetical protein
MSRIVFEFQASCQTICKFINIHYKNCRGCAEEHARYDLITGRSNNKRVAAVSQWQGMEAVKQETINIGKPNLILYIGT